ncbi:MAG: ATP-binding protein [Ignavibacteria bacterium]|nr:ATP-binding protein [Ignavibacteria bacterium]
METKLYNLEINSDPNDLVSVEEFVNMVANEAGFEESKLPGLMLALTEATTNAMIHGNKKVVTKKVRIQAEFSGQQLVFRIKDEGMGFDPTQIPDPTMPENLMKDSGRGLYLMRIYADELKYNITDEGTETILVINL